MREKVMGDPHKTSFWAVLEKIAIAGAVPVAVTFFSFLYDLKIGQDRIIFEQVQSKEEDKQIRKEVQNLYMEIQIIKTKQETFVTQVELLSMMKRIELVLIGDPKNIEALKQIKRQIEYEIEDIKLKSQKLK
jgi:hypothetical protein